MSELETAAASLAILRIIDPVHNGSCQNIRKHLTNNFQVWLYNSLLGAWGHKCARFWSETIIECSHIIGAAHDDFKP
jgi:hypothetical protein